ncbi:MAG: hypothetical protein WBI82_15665 [Sphaerochaeta sp.]
MPSFPPQGAGYLTLLSRHSLGIGTMVMLPLLSLRWGINKFLSPNYSKLNPMIMYSSLCPISLKLCLL